MRFHIALATGVTVVALTAAGCGGGDSRSPLQPRTGTDSGAATLRATLTALLTDHVHQMGTMITAGATGGVASAAFTAAADTLDDNTIDLSKAVESVHGRRAGRGFLGLWRSHIDMFVAYMQAKQAGDEPRARAAERDLDGYRDDFAAFMEGTNPNLPKETVRRELRPHVETVLAMVDAAVEKSPRTFERLAEAASHVPATAKTLAVAIAEQQPTRFNGAAADAAADLRADLTSDLANHVYRTVIALREGLDAGQGSRRSEEAARILEDNTAALAGVIEGVYGSEVASQFASLWRAHIVLFADYARAQAAEDDAGADRALARLDDYGTDFGAFLERTNPAFSKDHVAGLLRTHVEKLAAAVRAVVAQSPRAPDRLAEAAEHMPHLASTLAAGIAKQHPQRFPS